MKPLLTCGSPKINVRNLTDVTDGSVRNVSVNVNHDIFKAVCLVKTAADSNLLSRWDD